MVTNKKIKYCCPQCHKKIVLKKNNIEKVLCPYCYKKPPRTTTTTTTKLAWRNGRIREIKVSVPSSSFIQMEKCK